MELQKGTTYILAGATGTEIQRRGFQTKLPLWSAQVLFDKPELLIDIYTDYIQAGAEVITTNTFRTQRRTLVKVGQSNATEDINKLAVDLANKARQKARKRDSVFIAGSITTLEDCYRPDLVPPKDVCETEHQEQVDILADTGIDFFFLETFNTIKEAVIAASAVAKKKKQFCVSFTANEDGAILNGDAWQDAVEQLREFNPFAIMVNCVPPQIATRAVARLAPVARKLGIPFGVYANGAGQAGGEEGWDFKANGSAIDAYVRECQTWLGEGATFVGGCCGTTPDYTSAYARLIGA